MSFFTIWLIALVALGCCWFNHFFPTRRIWDLQLHVWRLWWRVQRWRAALLVSCTKYALVSLLFYGRWPPDL